jgi:hypothetical protein
MLATLLPMRAGEARLSRGAAAMPQVADWLEKLGLGQYAQRFAESDISFSVLPDLTDQDLKEIGVSLGHRRQLLRAIAELTSREKDAPKAAVACGDRNATPPNEDGALRSLGPSARHATQISLTLRRSSISVVSRLDRCRRPPPLRRTRPFGRGAASRSFSPRPMVERASPVISETASRPPHPVARTSPAANTRRPRSSSFEPTDPHLCRIACVSIMPARILSQRHPGNPIAPSQITTVRPSVIRFTCCDGCP